MTRYDSVGLSLLPRHVEALEDAVETRQATREDTVTRSEVARDWLDWGEMVEDILADVPEFDRMHAREQRALVRQALQDHLDDTV